MSGKESAPRGESVLKLFCPAVGNDIITGRVYCAILSFRINSTFFLKKKKKNREMILITQYHMRKEKFWYLYF